MQAVTPPPHHCPFFPQGISVVEQEKLDNMMIEMDGTENKCKCLSPQPTKGPSVT